MTRDFFNPTPEEQQVALFDVETLRRYWFNVQMPALFRIFRCSYPAAHRCTHRVAAAAARAARVDVMQALRSE
jgi:hypothetical protein